MKFSEITTPLVSVVIPVYNRDDTVGRAISSVLNQSYKNFELIVVDDCSSDNSLKVICEFQDERIRVIALKRNLGANAARNKGIMEARGEYVAFQDSDDEWDKDKLQLQIKDMLSRNLLASFCAHRLIDSVRETIIPNDYDNKEKYETELADVLANHNVISTQTLVVRKDIFRIIGDFD
ncbi:MAG: glycosyltransferase, partial [Anaeroplasmataceae bacterium]|nr:glycosyltransferase [Anaeroplasmataceae bacterium]